MNRTYRVDGTWHRRNGVDSVTVQGSGVGVSPWTPISGSAVCWYDADDPSTITEVATGVSSWLDKSGNGNNATQATTTIQPQYLTNNINGRNVLNFRGADRLGHSYAQAAIPISIFAVCNVNYGASQKLFYSTEGATTTQTLVFTSGPDNAANDSERWGVLSNTTSRYATNVIVGMEWNIIGLTRTTGGTFYLNGSTDGTFLTDSQGSSAGFIGGSSVGNSIQGKIGEIVVFNSSIDTTTRQKLEGYLAHKWGLTRLLPSTHPWKYLVPQT